MTVQRRFIWKFALASLTPMDVTSRHMSDEVLDQDLPEAVRASRKSTLMSRPGPGIGRVAAIAGRAIDFVLLNIKDF